MRDNPNPTVQVHTERTEHAEALHSTLTKLQATAEQLANLLDEDVPALEEKRTDPNDEEEAEMEKIEVETSSLGDLWEDEDTKSFYENLVDLKAFIPAILYKDSASHAAPQQEEEVQEEEDFDNEVTSEILEEVEEVTPPNIEGEPTHSAYTAVKHASCMQSLIDEGEEQDNQTTSSKMQLDAFLDKLATCVSRDMIDNAAVDFCMNLNTKNNRKKLVK